MDDEYWAAVLRKHAHIIDKGLQQGGREPGHSAGVYAAALDVLHRIESPEMKDDPSVQWAIRKLEQYDSLQQGHSFQERAELIASNGDSYRHLLETIKGRRSARDFVERPVDHDTIRQVVEVVSWAPQSCNRQTTKVFSTNDLNLVRECMSTTAGATCFGAYVPCFMSFCADLRPYSLPNEIWLPYVDVSLGVQNCCLVAHALGLSITLLSWCQSKPPDDVKLRRLLSIPDDFVIGCNGVMGYPNGLYEAPARKDLTWTCVIRAGE